MPVVTLAIPFELIARRIPTTYSTKVDYFNKKKNQLEILVLGSSHSNFGINPQYFGREAFNISNTSQGLYQDYKVLLKYLPECKNVRLVIVPISYFSLYYVMALSPEAWRCTYYSLYMGVQGDDLLSLFDSRNYSALFLWDGPLGTINGIQHVNKININEFGYQYLEKTESNVNEIINDQAGRERVAFHDKIMHYNALNSNMRMLDKITNELKKRNIKTVFVITPVYKTYYQHISKIKFDVMTNTIDKIAKKYSAKSVNYFYDNRFTLNDFMDNDHLNEKGAEKFSIILKHEVIDKLM